MAIRDFNKGMTDAQLGTPPPIIHPPDYDQGRALAETQKASNAKNPGWILSRLSDPNTRVQDAAGATAGQEAGLFEDLPQPSAADVQAAAQARAKERSQGTARVLEPNRQQVELRASDLESLLAEDHRARLVWGYVKRQDMSALFDAIKARGSVAGRAAIDPRILFSLWAVRHAGRCGQRA